MNKIFSTIILLIFILVPINSLAVDKEMVIEQMNSCVNTLTNIINNKSMTVLEHETDQLINNLTIQQLADLPEIADFRIELIDGIGKLGITEEERSLLKRLNSMRKDNLKWRAFSNALSNTMLITGGGNIDVQTGFLVLLTAARTAVEYKADQNDLQIDELQAMWELRKDDLKTFVELRKQAIGIVFSLYQKYNLKESDRLTEQTSQQFQKIISDSDPYRMVRLLLDNKEKFGHMADYYYYLGMGYVDTKNINKAMEAFKQYDILYSKAPIYRINEKSGLISLARLTFQKNLSYAEIDKELVNVQKNLPSNAMALIPCASVYNTLLNNPTKALSILRSALDDENVTDKAAIIVAGSLILPRVSSQSPEYKNFLAAYSNIKSIDLIAALNICVATKNNIFKFLENTIKITDLCHRPWFFGSPVLNDEIKFYFSDRYSVDLSQIQMYVETKDGNKVTVSQYGLKDARGISLEKINKEKVFKNNPNLKYLYMYSIGDDLFRIKDNIDYKLILEEKYPRQSEFILTEGELKDIVDFLKKNEVKTSSNVVVAEKIKGADVKTKENDLEIVYPKNYNFRSIYKNFKNQGDVTYVKFVVNDSRELIICYKFDQQNTRLIPCYTQSQGKIYFVNKSFLNAFGYGKNKDVKPKATKEVSKSDRPWWKFWGSDEDPKEGESKKAVSKKVDANAEKPWWKFWGSDEDSKEESKKEAPKKKDTTAEKPWWKFWGSDEDSKEESKKESSKKEEATSEKPWWKFWGSDESDDKDNKK